MSDDWVHPPGWDPESKAKAAAERKEKSFFRKYRYCLIPIVLGAIAGLSVVFLFQETITFNRGTKSSGTLGLEFLVYGMAFSLTMMIVIRILDGNSYAQSNAKNEKERKAAKRSRKLMWAFVPMILAILTYVLMIPVTLITGYVGSLGIAAMWILLAAALTVLILIVLFVTSLFDAAEKRSRRPPTD